MSGRERDFLDDMMDTLDEFWLYHQVTKDDDDDDDVDLDFDADFDIDDDTDTYDDTDADDEPGEDLILTASGSARTVPYQEEDPGIYNDFFDGKNAGYEKGYELGFFAGYDTGRYDPPEKTPESPKPKDYAFSNGFKVGFDEGYDEGYEAGCKRSGHASELEKLKHAPYIKENVQPKQTAPVNVKSKLDDLLSADDSEPADEETIKKRVKYVDTNDPLYKVKDKLKLIGCVLLIFVITIIIVIAVEAIKKNNKKSSDQSSTSYNGGYAAKTTKYTGTFKTYTTKRTTTRK